MQSYSPVSYLDLGIAEKGIREFKSTHDNITYYFTSESQKSTFEKNPKKYVPQFGGFCAYGVYAGALFRPDPGKFIIKDGKYYLFLSNLEVDARDLWLKGDHAELLAKASSNWSGMTQ